MPRTIAALAIVTILAACEPSSPENQAATYEELPELPVEVTAVIGGAAATGPAALGLVRDVALLHDADRLAVADWDSQEIRVFDLRGQYVETLGRRGEGPGEFKALGHVASFPGGAVVGWDEGARRVTMFLDDGLATIEPDLSVFPQRGPAFLGLWPDTTLVLRLDLNTQLLRGHPAGPIVDTVRVARFNRQGQVIGTPDTVVGPTQTFFDNGQFWGMDRAILGATLHSTMGGNLLVVSHGRELGPARAPLRRRGYPRGGPSSDPDTHQGPDRRRARATHGVGSRAADPRLRPGSPDARDHRQICRPPPPYRLSTTWRAAPPARCGSGAT